MTYEEILQDALGRIPNTFDKREGSVIYDAIAPCCYELALAYAEMERKLKNTYAGTAEREGLVLRAQEIGIAPYESTYAIRKGVFTPSSVDVLGSMFSFDNLNFVATKKISDGVYEMTCQTVGEVGNRGNGLLIPIEYINGLETATLSEEVLIYGEEEEKTEAFRERYFETLKNEAIDGNIAQYIKWCNEYHGIGNAKVFPLWNGKNTVKVSILNTENGVASDQLVAEFQEYLDPNSEGLGNGKAPIGAIVTVSTAFERSIDVRVSVTLKSGYISPIGVEESIRNFFKNIAYKRDFISYIELGSAIYMSESVDGVGDLFVNNTQSNIQLSSEEIPVLNSVDITVK